MQCEPAETEALTSVTCALDLKNTDYEGEIIYQENIWGQDQLFNFLPALA